MSIQKYNCCALSASVRKPTNDKVFVQSNRLHPINPFTHFLKVRKRHIQAITDNHVNKPQGKLPKSQLQFHSICGLS